MKYKYPLPNKGSGYYFSEQELVKLLDSVYDKGFQDGVQATNIYTASTYTGTNTECMINREKK